MRILPYCVSRALLGTAVRRETPRPESGTGAVSYGSILLQLRLQLLKALQCALEVFDDIVGQHVG